MSSDQDITVEPTVIVHNLRTIAGQAIEERARQHAAKLDAQRREENQIANGILATVDDVCLRAAKDGKYKAVVMCLQYGHDYHSIMGRDSNLLASTLVGPGAIVWHKLSQLGLNPTVEKRYDAANIVVGYDLVANWQ